MHSVVDALRGAIRGNVTEGESLARRTSVRIGGPADILVEAFSEEDIAWVRRIGTERDIPLRVIGNGSNVLVSDQGVRGIVLWLGRRFNEITFDGHFATCQAGATLPRFAKMAADRGLAGIEFGGGIPGTVGGAIVMNAGAHGGEIAKINEQVFVINGAGERIVFSRDEMAFSYRRSRLSGDRESIVVGGRFKLTPDNPDCIRERMQQFSQTRRVTQPLGMPSSGSVFKNPPGDYAGRLVEAAGLKGTRVGQAMVSEAHGNFIVNCGGATSDDVMRLIQRVRQQVLSEFGIELELEVELIGM